MHTTGNHVDFTSVGVDNIISGHFEEINLFR